MKERVASQENQSLVERGLRWDVGFNRKLGVVALIAAGGFADERHVPVVVDVREEMHQPVARREGVANEAPAARVARELVEDLVLARLVVGPDRADDDAPAVGELARAHELGGVLGHAALGAVGLLMAPLALDAARRGGLGAQALEADVAAGKLPPVAERRRFDRARRGRRHPDALRRHRERGAARASSIETTRARA